VESSLFVESSSWLLVSFDQNFGKRIAMPMAASPAKKRRVAQETPAEPDTEDDEDEEDEDNEDDGMVRYSARASRRSFFFSLTCFQL